MQMGMIGLGRMGGNMVRRLVRGGHTLVVHDKDPQALRAVAGDNVTPADSLQNLIDRLPNPRAIWLMLPAAHVDETIAELTPLLTRDDIIIDGGNSYYKDDIRRAGTLSENGIRYLDVGVSGGVRGLERGYCVMIGGDRDACDRLDAIFRSLAPGRENAAPTPGRKAGDSTAEEGYLYCGGVGAGHFVKMVHNGIEYGLMAAYAEGFDLLRHANVGRQAREKDAETAPLADPEAFSYDLDIPEIAELWRRGTVISSWLLDLTAAALTRDPDLGGFADRVADSGEGRWMIEAAVESGSPAPVLAVALFERFASRGEARFGGKLISAMRSEFGGHQQKR